MCGNVQLLICTSGNEGRCTPRSPQVHKRVGHRVVPIHLCFTTAYKSRDTNKTQNKGPMTIVREGRVACMTMFYYELKGKFSTLACQNSRGEMSCARHNIKLPCKLLIVTTCLSSLTLETESIHHSALGDSPVAALFPMLTYTRVFPVDHLDLHLDPPSSLNVNTTVHAGFEPI